MMPSTGGASARGGEIDHGSVARRIWLMVVILALLSFPLPGHLFADSPPTTTPSQAPATLRTGVWSNAGTMTAERTDLTLTLLSNGDILAAGGSADPRTEIFRASTGMWTEAASMSGGRSGATAALLANGKVLIAGGYNYITSTGTSAVGTSTPGYQRSAELYDATSGKWSPTGSMTDPRWYHRSTTLKTGSILITGGEGPDTLRSAELYDPQTGVWSPTTSMTAARMGHSATLLADGRVLVTGGGASAAPGDPGYPYSGPVPPTEIYDPVTAAWTTTGNPASPRGRPNAILLRDGTVLAAGGAKPLTTRVSVPDSSAEVYDPRSGTWSPVGSMAVARSTHTMTLLEDGRVLVVGGTSEPARAEIYDPATRTWTTMGQVEGMRQHAAAVRLIAGQVLVAGGGTNPALLFTYPAYVTFAPIVPLGLVGG